MLTFGAGVVFGSIYQGSIGFLFGCGSKSNHQGVTQRELSRLSGSGPGHGVPLLRALRGCRLMGPQGPPVGCVGALWLPSLTVKRYLDGIPTLGSLLSLLLHLWYPQNIEVHDPLVHTPWLPWFPTHFIRGIYPFWGEGYAGLLSKGYVKGVCTLAPLRIGHAD